MRKYGKSYKNKKSNSWGPKNDEEIEKPFE